MFAFGPNFNIVHIAKYHFIRGFGIDLIMVCS